MDNHAPPDTGDSDELEVWREAQHLTAYHEAGHALAAQHAGREIYQIHSEWPGGATTFEGTNSAFVIFAGPWASARLDWPECAVDRAAFGARWAQMFTRHTDDWAAVLRLSGQQVTDMDLQIAQDAGRQMPPLPVPEPGWHEVMERLWPDIEKLALQIEEELDVIRVGKSLHRQAGVFRCWRKPGWTPDED